MTKFYNLNDLPANISKKAIYEFEYAWGKNMGHEADTLDSAKNKVMDMSGYSLQMYLQGRTDKLSQEKMELWKWTVLNLLPENVVKSHPFELDREHKFIGLNHQQLAQEALEKLWNLYVATPNLEMPANPSKSKFSFKNLFK